MILVASLLLWMVICIFLPFTSTIAFCSASRVPSSIDLKRHLASDSKSKILAQSLGYLDVKLPVIEKTSDVGGRVGLAISGLHV